MDVGIYFTVVGYLLPGGNAKSLPPNYTQTVSVQEQYLSTMVDLAHPPSPEGFAASILFIFFLCAIWSDPRACVLCSSFVVLILVKSDRLLMPLCLLIRAGHPDRWLCWFRHHAPQYINGDRSCVVGGRHCRTGERWLWQRHASPVRILQGRGAVGQRAAAASARQCRTDARRHCASWGGLSFTHHNIARFTGFKPAPAIVI